MDKFVSEVTTWLQNKVKEAKVEGLTVGVSGGLDSAVVAYLIKRAFPQNSLGVIMPIQTNETDLIHAEKVVNGCRINYVTIDLTSVHSQMYDTIKRSVIQKDSWNESTNQVNDANLRARLRMNALYSIATNYEYLVVGTDNAAEWYTGYFTKYGDGGVDLQPIIDLTKREVVKLATYLGVPEEVIQKQPSADLWEGQTDEEEMGTSYDKIDDFLDGKDIPKSDRLLIENMHYRTMHKRLIPPHFQYNKK